MRTMIGYNDKREGYTNSNSDIPKLYAITEKGVKISLKCMSHIRIRGDK